MWRVSFSQTHNQGLRHLFLTVFVKGPSCLAPNTSQCLCQRVRRGLWPLKDAALCCQLKSPSRVQDWVLLEGTEEKSLTLTRSHWFALQADWWYFTKTNTVLVSRPMKYGVVMRRGHTTILQRYNDDSSTAIWMPSLEAAAGAKNFVESKNGFCCDILGIFHEPWIPRKKASIFVIS